MGTQPDPDRKYLGKEEEKQIDQLSSFLPVVESQNILLFFISLLWPYIRRLGQKVLGEYARDAAVMEILLPSFIQMPMKQYCLNNAADSKLVSCSHTSNYLINISLAMKSSFNQIAQQIKCSPQNKLDIVNYNQIYSPQPQRRLRVIWQ